MIIPNRHAQNQTLKHTHTHKLTPSNPTLPLFLAISVNYCNTPPVVGDSSLAHPCLYSFSYLSFNPSAHLVSSAFKIYLDSEMSHRFHHYHPSPAQHHFSAGLL